MKIAALLNLGVPWARETAGTLAAMGHEVHAIDFTTNKTALGHLLRDDPFQSEDIRRLTQAIASVQWLTSVFRQNLRYVSAAPSLRRMLRRLKPDVLLTLYSGGFATLAQLSRFRPYCTWVVGSDVLLARGLNRRLLASALTSADLVLANGDYLAQATRTMAPRAPVEALLLGTDLTQVRKGPKREQPVTILSNRGFNPVYQNDFIVRALATLKTNRDFRFVFASNGPELGAVKRLASDILPPSVRDRVEFLGGVSRERMLQLLAECRYFVSMARSDGTATSLLEAMAADAYPVLSDIPQNREWVRPEWHNGTLVRLESPSNLTRALETLLAEKHIHSAALDYNRHQVEDRADAGKNLTVLVDRLTTLANPRRKRP